MSTRFFSKVNRWLQYAQFFLLPGTCIVCRRLSCSQRDICPECLASLPLPARPCRRCALPMAPGAAPGRLCAACATRPPPFAMTVIAFDYREPVDRLIAGFKYRGRLAAGKVLAGELSRRVRHVYRDRALPDMLVPVPLHGKRLRRRGFNQTMEIARHLSRELGIPVNPNLCRRRRDTPAQQGLTAAARKRNMRGAFALTAAGRGKRYRRIAIVDDVMTTMATAAELSRVLHDTAAEEIHVWALARAG